MSSIYHEPEAFSLEMIWNEDFGEPYEFDIVAIWGSPASGAVFIGRDSGCSCPVPFEDYTSLASVNELERLDPSRLELLRSSIRTQLSAAPDADREKYSAHAVAAVVAWLRGQQLAVTQ